MVFKRQIDEDEVSSNEQNEFSQMLDESFNRKQRRLKVGDRVRCEILNVGKDHVIVSTGTPHDGFVQKGDFLDEKGESKVKTGDSVELFVTAVKGNEIYLSPKQHPSRMTDNIADAFAQNLSVEGKIEEAVNGGFRVSIFGKRAFCPIGQLDSKRIEKTEEYIGKKFDFKVTQYSEGGRNIVVSRRSILNGERTASQATFFEKNKVGTVVSGTVSKLEKFGAFVELAPGIDGLVHISEISYSRVNAPSQVLEVGQQVSCTILKIEDEGGRKRISLSIKQTQAEPWTNLPEKIVEGTVIEARVTRCLKFGAFAEVAPGIEGLVPMSEMSFTKRVAGSDELFREGEIIKVKIKAIDAFARRISLSFREAENPDGAALASSSTQKGGKSKVTIYSGDADWQEYQQQKGSGESSGSFGVLGAQLQAALDKKVPEKK
jgi:small subunit ribosomal protein S1